jgi:RNA-binding protein YhbY
MYKQTIIQIGKNGVNQGLIGNLKLAFTTHTAVKVSVLKSTQRDRLKIKEMADNLVSQLGKHYTAKIIGFTIILKKWRKEQVKK